MRKCYTAVLSLVAVSSVIGYSALSKDEEPERGPGGTIAYQIQVEASEPARIEAENDYIGNAPVTVKIWGDSDGTFHNFGSDQYVIKAYPMKPGEQVQAKIFRTGGWFGPEDKIPKRVFFDFTQRSGTFSIDLPPGKQGGSR